ncbi:MAG: toprim domain-containing protein, partial [Candidatus Atribacteria bacterium]|nr:toprim domain-containing protein [Candidatus Atribacteria bacterium]
MKELDIESFKEYKTCYKEYATCWSSLILSYGKNLDRFPLIREGFAHELNVSREALFSWVIGYDGQAFTIPMQDNNSWSGIQRRFPNGKKCCVQGSKLGIMCSTILDISPEEPLFICEGFTDAISVHDLGFNSIARPHCHFIDGVIDYLNQYEYDWDDIIIIPDNDAVGTEGAKNLAQKIIRNVEYDHLNTFKFSGTKDIR